MVKTQHMMEQDALLIVPRNAERVAEGLRVEFPGLERVKVVTEQRVLVRREAVGG
jgi:hypothetical protein